MKKDKHLSPPQLFMRFFRWFCRRDYLEDIEGDLNERFDQLIEEFGLRGAKRRFAWEVLLLFRPGMIRSLDSFPILNRPNMLKQNLKIGFRSLMKDKTYAVIKIGGFAIGITAFLLIALLIQDETSYDQHYVEKDRIYRLLNVTSNPDFDIKSWTAFQPQTKQLLEEDYPEVEMAGRMILRDWYLAGDNQFRKSEEKINTYEDDFAYADPEMLEILEIPMLYGSRETALSDPLTIVLSKRKAEQYFPGEDPVGRTVVLNDNDERLFTIGGVMDELPNSHVKFEFLITLVDVEFWRGEQTDWCCNNYDTYVRLKPGVDTEELEDKLLAIRDNYMIRFFEDREEAFAGILRKYRTFDLEPIGQIYLNTETFADKNESGDRRIVKLFGLIAICILLLACVNFINLFTAKSANRAKEIGVRKVVGSFRLDLVRQFLTESVLYSVFSVILGALTAAVVLPYFNQLIDKELVMPFGSWWLIPGLTGLALIIGVVAGIYPSLYLSSFRPIDILRGKLSKGSRRPLLRNGLVTFQFTTSIVLVISALVVYQQMQYILNKDVGFNKDQVVLIQGAFTLGDKTDAFKQELTALPMVEEVTNSNYFPVAGTNRDGNGFWIDGREKIDNSVGGQAWFVAENYVPTMKMELVAGRNFNSKMATDTAAVIINETLARKLGLDDPIGARIRNYRAWNVVGVVKDFHYEDMKQEIRPLALFRGRGSASVVAVRLKAEHTSSTVAAIQKVWDDFMPNQPIRYDYMDESYAAMYEEVDRTSNVFAACAVLAILIACLGLFGLSTFMVEQRSKEISVRKVLGASVQHLFGILTANYLRLIFLSLLLGGPLAWYIMQSWLENYTYGIDLEWWFFAVAGLLVAGIALLTVSRQVLRLSLSNPTEFLKAE
ncbi:MAG: ABC transporter permease [Saprospiraceae bacterium]|nr:ABC transporter permease [Saprospiraceae bacterium]